MDYNANKPSENIGEEPISYTDLKHFEMRYIVNPFVI